MRLFLFLVLCASTAVAVPLDAPVRASLTPAGAELQALRAQREEVSIAMPVTLTALSVGVLVTGLLLDGNTNGRPSLVGELCYLTSAVLFPAAFVLLARLTQRTMLSGHIQEVEAEVAAGR